MNDKEAEAYKLQMQREGIEDIKKAPLYKQLPKPYVVKNPRHQKMPIEKNKQKKNSGGPNVDENLNIFLKFSLGENDGNAPPVLASNDKNGKTNIAKLLIKNAADTKKDSIWVAKEGRNDLAKLFDKTEAKWLVKSEN
eukprot:jgi/Bigna1/129870/aug1.10_g4578